MKLILRYIFRVLSTPTGSCGELNLTNGVEVNHIVLLQFIGFCDFCDFDIVLGQSPREVPDEITLFVSSDNVATIKNIFYLTNFVYLIHLYNAHQPPIFNEVVALTPLSQLRVVCNHDLLQKILSSSLSPTCQKHAKFLAHLWIRE